MSFNKGVIKIVRNKKKNDKPFYDTYLRSTNNRFYINKKNQT